MATSITPLTTIADAARLDPEYLVLAESGRITVDQARARHILSQGFQLNRHDTDRLILGVQLYDLGLKDNDLRQLVIGLIRKELRPVERTELKEWYRRFSHSPSASSEA